MTNRSDRKVRALLALILAAGSSTYVAAQVAEDKEEESTKMEKFVVTGSLIPMAADSPANPVTVIGALDIEKSGVSSDLLQVLKKTEPYFYGANNLGSDNGNISSGSTNGGSSVALRNRATLVLINGRRAAVSPVLASGGGNFVDVSMIPVSAVERIEILADGASATYGSDAVSGVVNVILKSDYTGAEVGGRYGFAKSGGSNYTERSYSAVAGASAGKTQVTISTEWKKNDPLIQKERSWSRGLFSTPSYAGVINIGTDFYYMNPTLNAPAQNLDLTPTQAVAAGIYSGPLTQDQATKFFDLSQYPTMLLKAQRRSFVAAMEHKLTDSVTLFGDFIYTVNNTESVLNAQPVSGAVAGSNANNPLNVSATVRNRFVKFPRIYNNESTGTRGVFGVRGTILDSWNYEVAGNMNRTVHHFRNFNLIDSAKYTELTNSGAYNPFARVQAAGVIESMLGTSYRDYVSELNGVDARLSGKLFDLPGGTVQAGIGAETRRESLAFTNDRYDQTGGWLGATPRQPFSVNSTTDGFFGELSVPVFSAKNSIPFVHSLEVSAAARKDIYSFTEDPFVPKYTVKWAPFNDELILRGTYSESFSAPTLYDLFGPLSVGFTSSINIARYDTSGTALGVNTGNRQYRSRSGSNENLNPSESRNWTAGVVWSPKKFKGLEVAADWFSIDERDLISTISSSLIVQDVERYGALSQYAGLVKLGTSVSGETHFDDGAAVTTPGQLSARPSDEVWISNQSVNVAGVWQQGADVKVAYTYNTGSWGKLRGQVTAVYLHEYVTQNLPTSAPYNYTDSFSGTSVYPRFRTFSQLSWNFKNWDATVSNTYIPTVDDVANSSPYKVKAYRTFDLQLGYQFSSGRFIKGLGVQVGVNNVLDEEPPYIPSQGNQFHDINTYDPIGRFYFTSVKYQF